MEWNIERTQL